jgi:RimJ/RimL family protein N-acetyltransferase
MAVIRARGLVLRLLEATDVEELTQAVRESVDSAGPWLPWCHAEYGEKDARTWIRNCQLNARARRAFEFGVFKKDGKHLVGGAGLSFIDWPNRCANLGYWVRQSLQGRGVASTCVTALSEFGFRKLALHRIEIVVAVGNDASAAVARKSGALLECVARNRLFLHGSPVPAQVFSLIPE